jgi:hypothetical protein
MVLTVFLGNSDSYKISGEFLKAWKCFILFWYRILRFFLEGTKLQW